MATSYDEATAFCAWLSATERRHYRLPTDEEWSLAAGLGGLEQRKPGLAPEAIPLLEAHYPWGKDYPPGSDRPVANLGDEALHRRLPAEPWIEGYDDGYPTASPVMSFPPNRFGLFDLGGNVEEFCADWYDEAKTTRVVRGSCFIFKLRQRLLSGWRWGAPPNEKFTATGFRCVLVPDASLKAAAHLRPRTQSR